MASKTIEFQKSINKQLITKLTDFLKINFFIIDKNGHYICKNRTLTNIIGNQKRANTISKIAWKNSQYVMEKGETLMIEEHHIKKNGEKIIYLSVKSPLKDKSKKTQGIFGIALDITQRKMLEEKLRIAKVHTERALKAKKNAEAISQEKSYILKNVLKELKEERYYLTGKYKGIYLTKREAECILCLARGYTAKETGKLFNLSFRTTETHINNVKKKLHCNSRSELISIAIESNFLDGVKPTIQNV